MKNTLGKTVLAAVVPFGLGLVVHRQGFNLLDDGLWLLGAKTIAQGNLLYRDLFSIYGPVRYLLLLPFFSLVGQSALALVLLKAVTDGVAAALGYRFSRRLGAGSLAWLVPLGVVALGPIHPRYVAAAGFAWLVGRMLTSNTGWRSGFGVGLAWGGLALFGLDSAAAGLVIVSVALILAVRARPTRRALSGLASGLGTVLAVAALMAMALGVWGAAYWDTVVYPTTRFAGAMGLSWFATFGNAGYLGEPFAELMTGESLPAVWSGHEFLRVAALRAQLLGIWLVAPLGLWVRWRDRKTPVGLPLGCAIGLALAGWATLTARTDMMHLSAAWYGSLILLPVAVRRLPGKQILGTILLGVFAVLVFLPQTGEKLWLATHGKRPTLQTWERSTAKIQLATTTIRDLEELFTALPWDGWSPLLVWPLQPGLNFLLDAPLATSQVTLLIGEVRDPRLVIAELEKSRPRLCLQGSSSGIFAEVCSVKQLAPELWTYLRRNYGILSKTTTLQNQYWILERVAGGESAVQDLPLDSRLVDNEQRVANQTSVHLEPGLQVGQSFVVGDMDFSGIAVIWLTAAPLPVQFPVQVRLWGEGSRGFDQPLGQWRMNVTMQVKSGRSRFSVAPVTGTAGRRVAVTFEALVEVPEGLYLRIHTPIDGQAYQDFYPDGGTLVAGRPVDGDLYFLSY